MVKTLKVGKDRSNFRKRRVFVNEGYPTPVRIEIDDCGIVWVYEGDELLGIYQFSTLARKFKNEEGD